MNISSASRRGRLFPIGAAALILAGHSGAAGAQPPGQTPPGRTVQIGSLPLPVEIEPLPLPVEIGSLPLPVKNVDGPRRTPFSTRSQILPSGGAGNCFGVSDCANYVESTTLATFDLPTVPAGKRWVVVAANGGLVNGVNRTNQIELLDSRGPLVFDGLQWVFAGPFLPSSIAFGSVVFSEQVHAVFDEGETPSVRVSVASPDILSGYSVLVFHGYLEDIVE